MLPLATNGPTAGNSTPPGKNHARFSCEISYTPGINAGQMPHSMGTFKAMEASIPLQ